MSYKFKVKPLAVGYNKLRTAGLASSKSATFGMVRRNKDGTARAHQGIDLAVEPNYRCYAVDDGLVVQTSKGSDGYGWTVTLKLNNGLYVFYAHLSQLKVTNGEMVKAGHVVGLTGSTGNAKGMTNIAKGAHLHFEVRDRASVTLGLGGRLNPLDYFSLDS